MAYPLLAVRVDTDRATKYLSQLRTTAQQWGRSRTVVFTDKIYGFGIETGFTRRGRLARRDPPGGAFMVRDGIEEARPRIGPLIKDSFTRNESVPLAEANIGRMVVAAIQRRTPVRSGNLRDSFRFGVS
jgi:hypothetical protein